MFSGTYTHAIDAKGRTSLPAKFREVLASHWSAGEAPQVVVTRDPLIKCLRVYPMPEWHAVQARLAEKTTFDRRVATLVRLLVGSAQETQVDKLGRMLIAPALREAAELTGKVAFVGFIKYIEIWNQQHYEEWVLEQQQGENVEKNAQAVQELGL